MVRWIVCMWSCLVLLSGCWSTLLSTSDTQTISFDTFSIAIPTTFSPINAGLVENKQILNKVLKSFKNKDAAGFASNIVIARSSITPDIDYEQFWTANSKKLQAYLVNYQPGEQRIISFSCGADTVKWILVSFHVSNSFVWSDQAYAMAQFQFVYQGFWYIISLASASQEELTTMIDGIADITCTLPTTPWTGA